MPGEEEIVMFLFYWVPKLAGKSGPENKPAMDTMRAAMNMVQQHCKFKFGARFVIPTGYNYRMGRSYTFSCVEFCLSTLETSSRVGDEVDKLWYRMSYIHIPSANLRLQLTV